MDKRRATADKKGAMPDFWRSSGYHLLERGAEACAAERALHARLLDDPFAPVPPEALDALADPDAGDNYRVLLDFRSRLLAAPSLEGCYLGLFLGASRVPPLFRDQLAHVILRHILGEGADPLRARAAELFFRPQRVTLAEGSVMLADAETVERYAATGGFGSLGRLVAEAQAPLRAVALDVLHEEEAGRYWSRDERHDLVLDISFARPGLDAFARVLEGWVRHMLAVEVSVQPVQRIRDERWVWHVGLDAEASALLNDLYNGVEVEEARLVRLLALFRLDFADPSVMLPRIAGRPVYLGLAMAPDGTLRLKPQNLLVNLPLAARG
jgi:hypothetical protein